ncbi:ABC transporter substrate-binding protein [Sporolactobacillus laevolacticus]|uniref:Nitrate ABC transporter substrate-binding protein n=1 Tax=Sporolactobacillus laevolacticus DSM 442 TaxID=1395513 RepID=V6IWX9_9BACL|nr:ABC transporter substrate-binding protein [Sporolactobacillus laevolacticus]EST11843.1 nitrate ABC transporter substrate-binding protein [Sporolactobacillus laevolacticus DSM 442]
MKKMKWVLSVLLMAALVLSGCGTQQSKTKKIVIAEPVHLIAYLPLYVADDEGYFKDEGLDVNVITATGGAHVTSVVSGDAWGVIGGPDSNQIANNKSKDPITSVVNVVNRANVYLMANKKQKLTGNSNKDLAEFMKGKTIAAGRYGGSPNLLTRYLLLKVGLDPNKDVKLDEPADAAAVVSLVSQGKADMANGAEPQINEGIKKGAWGEPFYGFPSLGDYAYSVISVKASTIKNDPKTVQKVVNAMLKGLKVVNENKAEAYKVLKKEFPTTPDASLHAAMDRAYKDNLWSKDGYITKASVAKPMDVLKKTGIYTKGYKYSKLVDMEFVNKAHNK